MGVSIPIIVITISLHLIAFLLAVGAERRRSTVPLSFHLPIFASFLYLFMQTFGGLCSFLCISYCKGKGGAG